MLWYKLDNRIVRPRLFLYLFATDQVAFVLDQHAQDLQRLFLHAVL
jgi:hypothetical protein